MFDPYDSPTVNWLPRTLRKVYAPRGLFYAYAPSAVLDGSVERYWLCQNAKESVIKDSIFYVERVQGKITATRPVLHPGPAGAWDSFHVCDPSVVAGRFRLRGKTYRYALFYLGNDVDASYHNQIGVAFSNELSASSWVRYPGPIVPYPNNGHWGVGQPSVTSIDGKGRLLLFYTRGAADSTGGYSCEIDLTDMDRPIVESSVPLTNAGLTDVNGNADSLNNFDLVHDPSRNRFIIVREQHPYPRDNPSYIGVSLQVASIPAAVVRSGGGRWTVEGEIGPELTKLARSHNAGILRTLRGTLPDKKIIRVLFASSCAGSACEGRAEWTYDLWEITGSLTNKK